MSRVVQKSRSIVAYIRRFGVLGFLHELRSRAISRAMYRYKDLRFRLTNYYYERRLGVETTGKVHMKSLGFANPELVFYEPTGYEAIYAALAKIPLDKSKSTFLDYGCGKGRAVIAAATLPFRRIIGLDISERLLAIAQKNLATMRHKRCACVELVHLDATQYVVPKEVNLIYFYNPFIGQVLRTVVSNIYDSYQQLPREMYIVFFYHYYFEELIKDQHWLTRIDQWVFHHADGRYICGIYKTTTSSG